MCFDPRVAFTAYMFVLPLATISIFCCNLFCQPRLAVLSPHSTTSSVVCFLVRHMNMEVATRVLQAMTALLLEFMLVRFAHILSIVFPASHNLRLDSSDGSDDLLARCIRPPHRGRYGWCRAVHRAAIAQHHPVHHRRSRDDLSSRAPSPCARRRHYAVGTRYHEARGLLGGRPRKTPLY